MTKISEKMSAIAFDRAFRQSPERVFAAFSRIEQKSKWFTGPPDATENERVLDFRVGGREILEVLWKSGAVSRFDAKFHHVDTDRRIVYSYDLLINGELYSTSLTDIMFERKDGGTVMSFAESTSYFSDQDLGEMTTSRMHGTRAQIDMMATALADEPVVRPIPDCH